jgi:hypothetical protein
MSSQRETILRLVDALTEHEGVTHWAISMRIFRKGDFFAHLKRNGDCRSRTAAKVLQWFSDHWPSDLEWPADIHRPSNVTKRGAA